MSSGMDRKRIGKFTIEVWEGWPMWTKFAIAGANNTLPEVLMSMHHEEIDDAIYALKQARKHVRAKLKEKP